MTETADIAPGFILLQGNKLESLRQVVTGWLKAYPLKPLESETILVQSNGMAQWLRLGLAQERRSTGGGLGIATALEMILPARLQWQCYRTVLGSERVPTDSPLDKNQLVWRLMRLLPSLWEQSAFKDLRHYILTDDQPDERRLYQLALRIADQLDQYQVYRADWLLHWQTGHNDLPVGQIPLDLEQHWQPILWRALVNDVQGRHPEPAPDNALDPTYHAGRSGLHQAFRMAASQLSKRPEGLPRRIIVFGLSTLAPQILEVLATVAQWSQVIVCLQNPCQHYWGDMIDGHQHFPPPSHRLQNRSPRIVDATVDPQGQAHPLLAAWGRQGRDLMRMLDTFDESARFEKNFTQNQLAIDLFESPCADVTEPTILTCIQDDLLEARAPDELQALSRWLDPGRDQSIRFHSAHSPLREVEILHDQLLAAFDADRSLNPNDLIVMVPDMTVYAPAITAIFGRLERDDPRYIPFAISDQTNGARAPIVTTLEQLLHLPRSRLGRSEVLDLLGNPLLRARFDIADADLPIIQDWIDQAGIRWGLNAHHREHFGLPQGLEQNSWLFGLNRLLLGYLSGDSAHTWQGIEPYAGIDGSGASVLGGLTDLVERLTRYTEALQSLRTPEEWAELLKALMDDFLIDPDALNAQKDDYLVRVDWEMDLEWRARLLAALDQWLIDCQSADFTHPITIETVQSAWLERLEPHRLQQRFLVGGVNFATLMPMRTIPYRHIYLLGMDDANYPRRQPGSDFDLMAARYRPGDRSRREDDRYLFLEALLAARERLTISWVGRDIRKNTKRPASVLVNQLADYIDQFWHTEGTTKPTDLLTTEHPLHPFSHRYFSDEEPGLFTYASDWQSIHTTPSDAGGLTRDSEPARLPEWRPDTPLNIEALSRFLRHPAHTLWRARFNTNLPRPEETPADHEPFRLNGLDLWHIKNQINDGVRLRMARSPAPLADAPPPLADWIRQELHRCQLSGQFPLVHTNLDATLVNPLIVQWQAWLELQQHYTQHDRHAPVLKLQGPQGICLEDQLRDIQIDDDGQRARICFLAGRLHKGNTLDWHKLVLEWPRHLMAQIPGFPVHSHLVSETGKLTLNPVDPTQASDLLTDMLDAWYDAAQQPFPLACKTAFAWLNSREEEKRHKQAALVFDGNNQLTGERESDPLLARLWPDFTHLSSARTERGEDFAALAERLYGTLKTSLHNPETS